MSPDTLLLILGGGALLYLLTSSGSPRPEAPIVIMVGPAEPTSRGGGALVLGLLLLALFLISLG
jgi:hypothetical protein